jgi:hypothetical protein
VPSDGALKTKDLYAASKHFSKQPRRENFLYFFTKSRHARQAQKNGITASHFRPYPRTSAKETDGVTVLSLSLAHHQSKADTRTAGLNTASLELRSILSSANQHARSPNSNRSGILIPERLKQKNDLFFTNSRLPAKP